MPDEMVEAIVETTELKSKEELLKECYEHIVKINDILAQEEPYVNQTDREIFDDFLRKCALGVPIKDAYYELDNYLLNEFKIVIDSPERWGALKRLDELYSYPMRIWAVSDCNGTILGDELIYSENSKESSIEKIISAETGHILARKFERNIHNSVSEIYDIAASEAAGFPYPSKTIENHALLGRITMEHLSDEEKKEILKSSSQNYVDDYNDLLANIGVPSHQEAAYVYKRLKEKYGEQTLKILGHALANPEINLVCGAHTFYNNIVDFYDIRPTEKHDGPKIPILLTAR